MPVPFLPGLLINVIGAAVGEAVKTVAQKPNVPLEPAQAPTVAVEVAKEVAQQIQQDPQIKDIADRIAHVTSTEPWYRSRANWSAIVAGLTPLIAILGYNLAPEDQATIAGVLTLGGNLVAAYLARRARTATKPLGA